MKVGDLFPSKFLRGQDLPGPMLAQIGAMEGCELRPGPGRPAVAGWFVYVDPQAPSARIRHCEYVPGHGHRLILRRTLAEAIGQVCGSDDTDDWPGKRIVLFPEALTVGGRRVLTVSARAPKAAATAPATEPVTEPATEPATTTPPATATTGNGANANRRMRQAEAIPPTPGAAGIGAEK